MGFSLRGFSCCGVGFRCEDSVVVTCRPRCPAACGIFLDRGSNLCPCFGRQFLITGPLGKARTTGFDERSLSNMSYSTLSEFHFQSCFFLIFARMVKGDQDLEEGVIKKGFK